jgi:hypothetical protein
MEFPRLLDGATVYDLGTAGMEATAGRESCKVWRLARNGVELVLAAQLGDGIQERLGVGVLGMVE